MKQCPPVYYRRFAWLYIGVSALNLAAGCLQALNHRGFPWGFGMAAGWATCALVYFGNASRREHGLHAYNGRTIWTDLRSPLPERRRDALVYLAVLGGGAAAALGTFIAYLVAVFR
jgi:hypothetical protein